MGAVSILLQPTNPTVQIPHSMVRIYPFKTPGVIDQYLSLQLYHFPINVHAHRFGGLSSIMATSGKISTDAKEISSAYSHDNETSQPHYYQVFLEDYDINTSLTVAEQAAFFKFDFERPNSNNIIIRINNEGKLEITDNTISGFEMSNNMKQYFFIRLSKSCDNFGVWGNDGDIKNVSEVAGPNSGAFVTYNSSGTVYAKIGVSYISVEQAKKNLDRDIGEQSFEKIKSIARTKWEEALNKIQVEGGTQRQREIFYTSLYRTYERMVNITEDGKYYSGYDNKIHEAEGYNFYVDDWSWDSFRSHHPLNLLIKTRKEVDMIRSYIKMYEQSGWMPTFPQVFGDFGGMIGHNHSAIIFDAFSKGVRDFDVDKAYEGIYKNVMHGTIVPWREGPITELGKFYQKNGYFPALWPDEKETEPTVEPTWEKRQAVSVTLEHAYNAWCLAQFANALGKNDDYKLFSDWGQNYKNVFNPEHGFMAPKDKDGNWIEPFDPIWSGGPGVRAYYTEVNAWTYTWYANHDLEGLFNLMGGKEKAIEKLDQLFEVPLTGSHKFKYLSHIPDATGLVGQFIMGNEPSFHIPYLYNYLGQPWKTQKRVRFLMDVWYDNTLMGLSGDEDGGGLSSWYVLSAMGFYQVTPGIPVYTITSPIFDKITVNLDNGNKFVIIANNNSKKNKYIKSAKLNDKVLETPFFQHSDIINGATLELELVDRPTKWGT